MSEQVTFGAVEFADNPEPRVPCILLLDVSGSMQGDPIQQLNEGLTLYKDELLADSLAAKRVEVALVTFGGSVQTVTDFCTADQFFPPTLAASGDTPMGSAIEQAIELLNSRKAAYKTNGVSFYRPWIFLITDGGPTDAWQAAKDKVHAGESKSSFMFFAVGVEGANFETLKAIAVREPLALKGLRFRDLFKWLSNSQKMVSRSQPDADVALQDPTGPSGWASVKA